MRRQPLPACPLGWLLQNRVNLAVVQSWIPSRSSETREKTVLLEEAPRNPVQETALRAVSCTPGTPRSHARPRLVDRARSCHGTRSRSRERADRPPRTTRSPALRPSGSMSFVSRVRANAQPGPMDRAGPSAATTGDYGSGMPGDAVPDPAPRSTRTDPGPEGHVRRESREAWSGEGGGRAASLEPSAGACALSEPDSLGDGASPLLPQASPGFDVSYFSGDT